MAKKEPERMGVYETGPKSEPALKKVTAEHEARYASWLKWQIEFEHVLDSENSQDRDIYSFMLAPICFAGALIWILNTVGTFPVTFSNWALVLIGALVAGFLPLVFLWSILKNSYADWRYEARRKHEERELGRSRRHFDELLEGLPQPWVGDLRRQRSQVRALR
jgi:hypothetical protein